MTFRELRQALQTWKVLVAHAGTGRDQGLFIFPAVKKSEAEWKSIWDHLIPHVRKHSWAIETHVLKTWTLERILAYLNEWQIGVKLVNGEPRLVRGPHDEETWAYHWKTLLPHLKERRASLIAYYEAFEPKGPAEPSMKPNEEREVYFDVMVKQVAPGIRGRVLWFSRYTRETGFVQGDARFFPGDATAAAVAMPDGSLFVDWTFIPGHTPPPGWKLSAGVMPPYPCLPPPNWKPKTEEQIKSERARWYAENWKTKSTFRGDDDE